MVPTEYYIEHGSQTWLHIKITWRVFKNLNAKAAPRPIKSASLEVRISHQNFFYGTPDYSSV